MDIIVGTVPLLDISWVLWDSQAYRSLKVFVGTECHRTLQASRGSKLATIRYAMARLT